MRLDPPDAADDAEWFDVTAWQGGGLVVDPLERVAPGVYRTTEPIPVHGDWKAMIRLHDGNSLTRAADLPAARRGDPGRRNPGPGAASPAASATSTSCCSASRRAAARCWSRSPTRPSPAIALSLLALLAWALHRLAVGMRPAPRRRRLRLRGLLGFQHGGGR